MEKGFALGISGLFATLTAGVLGVPPVLFAQAQAANVDMLVLVERLGLGLVMAILGYKIIIKIIDIFGPPLLAKLNEHDVNTHNRLDVIEKKVGNVETHISSIVKPEQLIPTSDLSA